MAVTGDDNNEDLEGDPPRESGASEVPNRTTLRRVDGPIDGSAEVPGSAPAVNLLREYKGLTVADLLRDEIVDRLPGQVRTAVHHLQQGDYAAAERALPGEFTVGESAPMLRGPGSERRTSHRLVFWLVTTAALVAGTLASYWF